MPVPTSEPLATVSKENARNPEAKSEESTADQAGCLQHESMILVQVNPGETFTIQAENHTQCITGPAQVPMVSPNGAIPPIQVPHGYISQVIEDQQGYRKVVVIPENSSQFPVGPGTQQQMVSQAPHSLPHPLSMQPGPHYNYMQQMSAMPLNQQAAMTYPSGEHLGMFQSAPLTTFTPLEGSGADINRHMSALSRQHQFPLPSADMDNGRSVKVKERLQRRLREKQQNTPDMNQNPSPTSNSSISPSSSSSYAMTPSPNSSPDSSPRIISSSLAISKQPHGYQPRNHPFPAHYSLSNRQPNFTSPTHSQNYMPGNDGFKTTINYQHISPQMNTSEEASSGSSAAGSPRHGQVPSLQAANISQQDMVQQYNSAVSQRDAMFNAHATQEPYPLKDGKWTLKDYLSAITRPEVYDVQPRKVYLKWSMRYSPPEGLDLTEQRITFEIYIMHKGKDGNKFKLSRREHNAFAEIKDLKPGVEYHTKVLAELNSVKGAFSEVTKFRTVSCQPDTPGAPKMTQNTKNSISLKWNAPNDNGEKIAQYHLEWDEGEKGSGFRSLYLDKQKQYYHKVTKLKPSHYYTFRLNCRNKVGESPWSAEVTYRTSGTAPPVPDPPRLSKAFIRSLTLTWSRSNTGAGDSVTRFTLEMDDGMGYGFKPVYYGPDLRTQIKNLNRNTLYKFRLQANNNEGKSAYSTSASFYTLPDKPNPPGKVAVKGKAHPTWFKVAWDPPQENGGSDILKYVLECSHEKGQPMEVLYSGADTEHVIGNVQPGQTCRLRVYCVSNGGTSERSEVAVFTTPPVVPGQCSPPRAASKPKPTILFLRWDPPNYNGGSHITDFELAMDTGHLPESSIGQPEKSLTQIYIGPALEHSVGGLKCGTTYKFLVRSANKVGMGQWSDPAELETSPGPPEKADTPEPESVNSDSVLLTWKRPEDNGSEITSFSVEWGCENSTMNIHQSTGPVLSYNFQGLAPDTAYFFRVQAHNATGKGPFSNVATIKTLPSSPACISKVWQGDILPIADYIEELGMEDHEVNENTFPKPATSAMICWTTPEANGAEISGYILEVKPVKSGKKKTNAAEEDSFLLEIDGEDSCHLLHNLQPDSEYRIRVKAVNDIGSGPFSSSFSIETQPLPPDPPVIECTCSYNSLKLKWEDTDYNNFYLLQMKEKHGRFVTIHSGGGRLYTVKRLMERTTYHFRINARNNAGEGPFSDIYSFTTTIAPPSQVKNSLSITVQDGFADVSWDESDNIKGDSVSYLLNVESYDDPNMKQTIPLTENNYRISPVMPGTRYRVQVAAVRHANSGAISKMRDAATQLQDDVDQSTSEASIQEAEKHTVQQDIVGQYSNWYTFEVPVVDYQDQVSSKIIAEKLKTPSTTLTNVVNSAWTLASDETMAPVLLTLTFFVFAVSVAFFVQIMRV